MHGVAGALRERVLQARVPVEAEFSLGARHYLLWEKNRQLGENLGLRYGTQHAESYGAVAL
ncbi:MAG: hypothetical protein HOP19_26305 [Acidobacteria bacterium]|nr:hypothetical protein [Acidobacteriota bacterium]